MSCSYTLFPAWLPGGVVEVGDTTTHSFESVSDPLSKSLLTSDGEGDGDWGGGGGVEAEDDVEAEILGGARIPIGRTL